MVRPLMMSSFFIYQITLVSLGVGMAADSHGVGRGSAVLPTLFITPHNTQLGQARVTICKGILSEEEYYPHRIIVYKQAGPYYPTGSGRWLMHGQEAIF